MSYARFSYSDVYVFAHVGGFVQCCGCILGDEWDFYSAQDIAEHLNEHVRAGHRVPDNLLDPGFYPEYDFKTYGGTKQ